MRNINSESTCGRSTGSTSLSAETPYRPKSDNEYLKLEPVCTMGGLKVVIEKDGMTTNTGSGSQDDEYDEDTLNDDSSQKEPMKGAAASAMLLSAFVTDTIRIEIPINGNTDSGYGTSHVEHDTQLGICADFVSSMDVEYGEENRLQNSKSKITSSNRKEETYEVGDSRKLKKKSRFNLGRRNKSSRKKREKASAKRERKATKTLAIVLGMFLACWVPFFTCNILDAICIKMENDTYRPGVTIFLLTTWLGYINSCVNPVIYTIFNLEFRKAFKKLLVDSWSC